MGFLQQFFIGRNGLDQLNMALLAASVGLSVLSWFIFPSLFSNLAYVFLFLGLFRMISRNLEKRSRENRYFLELVQALRTKTPRAGVQKVWENKDQQSFSYLKCPDCNQPMRFPKGKGKIKITCSNCGLVFYEKV